MCVKGCSVWHFVFIIAHKRGDTKCLSVSKWFNRSWCIHIMEYYTAVKMDSIKINLCWVPLAKLWVKCSISFSPFNSALMCCLGIYHNSMMEITFFSWEFCLRRDCRLLFTLLPIICQFNSSPLGLAGRGQLSFRVAFNTLAPRMLCLQRRPMWGQGLICPSRMLLKCKVVPSQCGQPAWGNSAFLLNRPLSSLKCNSLTLSPLRASCWPAAPSLLPQRILVSLLHPHSIPSVPSGRRGQPFHSKDSFFITPGQSPLPSQQPGGPEQINLWSWPFTVVSMDLVSSILDALQVLGSTLFNLSTVSSDCGWGRGWWMGSVSTGTKRSPVPSIACYWFFSCSRSSTAP